MSPDDYCQQNGFVCTDDFRAGWEANELVREYIKQKAIAMLERNYERELIQRPTNAQH